MSGLDEKGLADAVKAHNDAYWTVTNDSEGARKRMEKAISAYLSAVGQKAGTVGVKADGDLMDQAVAFAEMWGTEQNWPHVRDAYVTAIMRERATGNGTSDRVSALTNGCNALLGLIHLVCVRDDMPAAIRDVLTTNHRIDEARAGLSISPHGDPICRKCATQEHGSYVPEECTCGDYPPPDPSGLEALSEKSIQTSDINGTMSFAIKPLEWRDHRGHTFPDTWTAKTPCGVYEIEERSASDSPAYITTGPLHVFISDRDSLEDAKAAAQADYEARIRSALIPAPSVAEAAEPVAAEPVGRVKVPAGQTPLNDKLDHPLLDALRAGEKARDTGERSPYHGHSLEHCLHAAGWVSRDLRLALDARKQSDPAPSPVVPSRLEALVERSVWLTTGTLESLFRDGSHVAVQTLVHRVPTKSGNCEQYVPVRASLCVDEGCPHHGTPHVCNPNEPFWGEPEHERQRMLDAIAALIAERDEARKIAGLGCDANGGGEHNLIKQGTYTFCGGCGSTIRTPSLRERARLAESRAETVERALSAAEEVIRFYAKKSNWWNDETSVNTQELFEVPMGDDLGDTARRWLAAAIRSSATKQEKAE